MLKSTLKKLPLIKDLIREREQLIAEREALFQERDQLKQEREQLKQEREQSKAEREASYQEQGRLNAERENIFQERKRLKAEGDSLVQQRKELESDRPNFITSLYQYLLKKEPSELDILGWSTSNHTSQELLNIFINTPEYQQSIGIPSNNNNLLGVLTKATNDDTYLLYPSFDKVQLNITLSGDPFQRSDFFACMKFLINEDLINSHKSCFFDIGANIGSTSIYALKSGYFSRAISIEPSSLNYEFLKLNAKINELTHKIQFLHCGIADFVGSKSLIGNPINCGDFRLSSNDSEFDIPVKNLLGEENFSLENTKFTTLDQLVQEKVIDLVDIGFIWMDCQGSEGLIFKGGQQFFDDICVPMYIEFWPYGINRLKGKDYYFSFLRYYSSRIFKFTDKLIQRLEIEELENFYNLDVETGEYFDILVIPKLK